MALGVSVITVVTGVEFDSTPQKRLVDQEVYYACESRGAETRRRNESEWYLLGKSRFRNCRRRIIQTSFVLGEV